MYLRKCNKNSRLLFFEPNRLFVCRLIISFVFIIAAKNDQGKLGWFREKVTTTKIRTSKTNQNERFVNNHYIESVFLVHHYYDKNQTFDVLILPMASKKIRTSKIKNIHYLWGITYGYQGLWGVRLGSIRLG